MDDKTISELIEEDIHADLCHRCSHGLTCSYYGTLKQSLYSKNNLSTVFDLQVRGWSADGKLPENSLMLEDAVTRSMPGSPIVGVVSCEYFKEAPDEP